MTSVMIALAGLMLAPASAPEKPAAPQPSETPIVAATPAAKPTNYCVVDTTTGTRIHRKTCRTRAEWMRQGFDPLDK